MDYLFFFLIHYLDDFLTMGPPSSPTCQYNLDTLVQIYNYLKVPLALEKVAGPSTALPFLGIELDTIQMEARLPEARLQIKGRSLPSGFIVRMLRSRKSSP